VTGYCAAAPSQRKRYTQVTLPSNSKHNEEEDPHACACFPLSPAR